MGIVGNVIHYRETSRLKAPITTETTLAPSQIGDVLRELERRGEAAKDARAAEREAKGKLAKALDWSDIKHRKRLYVAEMAEDDYLVSYPYPHDERRPKSDGEWIALVRVGIGPDDCQVLVQLARWMMKDGRVMERQAYIAFLDDFGEELRAQEARS